MDLRAYVNDDYPLPKLNGGFYCLGDTHWLHANIVEYEAEARQALPGDHNRVMLDRWCETVGVDDTVLHLGDLALGKKDDFRSIADRLPGKKYMLKTGNHE